MRCDDRAHDGPEDEAAQRERLRRESAVEAEEGEDDDAEQEKCVGDVHVASIRTADVWPVTGVLVGDGCDQAGRRDRPQPVLVSTGKGERGDPAPCRSRQPQVR